MQRSMCQNQTGTLALQSILELYVKVRIFSYAKPKTEKGKEKIKLQKKELRTELKRYEGSIANGSQMEEMYFTVLASA